MTIIEPFHPDYQATEEIMRKEPSPPARFVCALLALGVILTGLYGFGARSIPTTSVLKSEQVPAVPTEPGPLDFPPSTHNGDRGYLPPPTIDRDQLPHTPTARPARASTTSTTSTTSSTTTTEPETTTTTQATTTEQATTTATPATTAVTAPQATSTTEQATTTPETLTEPTRPPTTEPEPDPEPDPSTTATTSTTETPAPTSTDPPPPTTVEQ